MEISSLLNYRTILSLKVFPPERTVPADTICNMLDEFEGITSGFTSVIYGARGNESSQTTLKTASAIKYKYGIESVAYIPCLNLIREDVLSILEQLKEQKVENILAPWGDRVPDREPAGDLRYTSDLVEFIGLHGDFSIIDACYPKGRQESGDLVRNVRRLKDRVDASVSQSIIQFLFDDGYFYRLRERMDLVRVHVLAEAGTMPVVNKKQVKRMVSLCGVKLSKKFISVMERYGDNPIAMQDVGITYAVDQIADLVTGGMNGIHPHTVNNPYIASRIYEFVFRSMAS